MTQLVRHGLGEAGEAEGHPSPETSGIDPSALYSSHDTKQKLGGVCDMTLWRLAQRKILEPLYPFGNRTRRFRGRDILRLINGDSDAAA